MKKIYVLLLAIMSFAVNSFAQPSAYSFGGSSGTYSAISGTAVSFTLPDDASTGNLPIGFTFNYNSVNQTVFAASTNGLLIMGQTTNGTGLSSNALASTLNTIAALWDDNNMTGGTVQYSTTGTAPTRVLTVQYTGMHVAGSGSTTNPTIDLQILLYETSNRIQIIYGNTSATLSSPTASIGLSGASGNFLSVTPTSASAPYATTSNVTENSSVSSAAFFPTGTTYTFSPPPPCVAPTDQPTALTATGFNSAQINGTFTAAISAPNGYLVVRYPSGGTATAPVDGTTYTAGGALGTGTVVQSSAATTFTATGLTPTTTYDFYVYAQNNLCSGGVKYLAAAPLTGSGTTLALLPATCANTFTPLNAAVNQAITQTLTWSGATGAPAITGYNVYFGTNAALVTGEDVSVRVITNTLVTSYVPPFPGLAYGATYYWKVVPINSVGVTTGCITNSFSTYTPSNPTSTTKGGLWSSVATWVGGVVPIAGDNVTIADGAIVTVDQTVTGINNLTIGSGTSGTLLWSSVSNAMTLYGNLTINAGAKFLPYTTSGTGQAINVGGNFVNNGFANLALVSTSLNLNGSQQAGGSSAQSLSGTGVFQGNGTSGIIRVLTLGTTGTTTINTSQNLIVANAINPLAGTLTTNGKLSLDNTAQVYGQALNTQVASIGMTSMGSGYTTSPVAFGTTVTLWAASAAATAGTRYYFGADVYICSTAGTFDATTGPTHTSGIVANGTAQLLWAGAIGTIGNPFSASAVTLGTQYFYGPNLYTCIVAGTPLYAAPPVHTSGTAASGTATFLYAGTAATVTVNHDPTSLTVRSVELVNPGAGYSTSTAPVFVLSGGGGASAAGAATVIQSQAGPTSSIIQKSGSATISGVLNINSNQSVSAYSGVGGITTTNGGVNYTVAPLVGFAGPTAINLVTASGSGYATAPTITVTGGTLVSGAALTTTNFTITVNQGKVVSVYLNAATTATYSVPPTLAFSSGTATLAFPAGSWPAATVVLGTNRQITNFNITNAGFGYTLAPIVGVGTTSPSVAGGTFTTVATAPTCRIALYNLIINNFTPSPVNVPSIDDAAIPTNRKMNSISLGSTTPIFGNLNLASNIELFSLAPLTLNAGNLNMGGANLLCSNSAYVGQTGSLTSSVTNGSITLNARGGGSAGLTLNYPFDATYATFIGSAATVALGSTITSLTVSRTAAPTGANAIGTRAYNAVVNAGAVYGTNPTVTLNWNANDALISDLQSLFIGQSAALSGPWVTRSVTTGTGTITATGSRTTAIATVGPIVPTGNDYFAWVSTFVAPPALNYAVTRTTGNTYQSIAPVLSGGDGTGTLSTATGDETSQVGINIAAAGFVYQGSPVTAMAIHPNGYISLNNAFYTYAQASSWDNTLSPVNNGFAGTFDGNKRNVIAPFYDDLNKATPVIYYKISGSKVTAEWFNTTFFGLSGPQLFYQVVLDAADQSITFNYGNMQLYNGTQNIRYSYTSGISGAFVQAIPQPGQVMQQQYENTTFFTNENGGTSNWGANGLAISPDPRSSIKFTPGAYVPVAAPIASAPTNDEPAGAITRPALAAFPSNIAWDNGTNSSNLFTTRFATNTATPANCGGAADAKDVWFKFVAPNPSVTVRIYGSGGFIPRVSVYDNALTPLPNCVVGTQGLIANTAASGLTIGNTYYVRVYHDNTGTQATATATVSGGVVTGVTVIPGTNYSNPATAFSGYSPQNQGPRISFSGGGGNGAAAGWVTPTAATGVLPLTAGNLSLVGGSGYTSAPTVTIESPDWGITGEFGIVLFSLPENDDCSGAKDLINLSNTSCVNGQNAATTNTQGATASAEATVCGTPDDDLWYKFTAVATFTTIRVQGTGTFDAAFQLYDGGAGAGACATKTAISCTNATTAGALESINATTVIGNTYFVRVFHAGTGSAIGETFNICVNSLPPACPTGLLPALATSIDAAVGATLSWTAAALPSSPTTGYDVYFDTNNPPTTIVSANQPGTTYATGVLTANTTYYWSIAPKNSVGTTTGCTIANINTNPPLCPTLPNPATASSTCLSTTATVLSWTGSAGATGYDVYFDAGAGPATTIVSTNQAGLTYNAGVLSASQYTWKVIAKNNNGASIGCVDWTFTVNPKPTVSTTPTGTVAICSPATQTLTGTTNAATPTYQWLNNNLPIATATNITYIATASGNYRLKVTDGVTGCTDTSVAVTVTVSLAPTVSINPATAILSCDSVKLVASGSSSIKITEVTLFNTGTGQTPTYPSYATAGSDFVEISNISSSPVNVGGYTFADYANASATITHPYTIPGGTIIPANSVLLLHLGTGTDDVPNLYFNTSGTSDTWSSGSVVGFVLKNNTGTVIDVVACGGSATGSYTFDPAVGVTALDWTGFAPNVLGFAGIIRVLGADNNLGSDWIQSNTPSPLQTIGTYTTGYTVPTYLWTPALGLYKDALLTLPYTNENLATVYAKPTAAGNTIYTVQANSGACSVTSTATVTVLPIGTLEWTGAVNTAWDNTGNWKCGIIPILTSNVIINGGLPNYPIIMMNVEIKSIVVNPTASVTVGTGFELKLNGN
jgi:Lamin Tail Domain